MNGSAFKLAMFDRSDGAGFAAIVLGDDAIDLTKAHDAYRAAGRRGALGAASIDGLLEDWDANFAVLQEIVAFLEKEGKPGATKLAELRPLSPVRRPGKMFYAAQNFQEHVEEMLRA